MRIKVVRGREPGGLCRYLLSLEKREPGHEQDNPILHSNMFGATDEELAEELRFSGDLNARVDKIVCHYQISFPPKENPDRQTKQAIIADLLAARSHGDNCQFFAIEHFERIHKKDVHHLHVVAAAVRLDGSWVNGDYEWDELRQIERDLEEKHHLQLCPPRPIDQQKNLTNGESRLKDRTGETLPKEKLWNAIDQAIIDQPTMPQLLMRLKAQGIEVQFHERIEKDKRKLGLSFGIDGSKFQGKRLGKAYSFGGLIEHRGVSYQADRDDELLGQIPPRSDEECRSILQFQAEAPLSSPAPVRPETTATAWLTTQRQAIDPPTEPERTAQPIEPEPTAQPIETAPASKAIDPTPSRAAQNILQFFRDRLQQTQHKGRKNHHFQTPDDRYSIDWDAHAKRLTITWNTGKIMLEATRTQSRHWNVTIDQVQPQDECHFKRYQQQRKQQAIGGIGD